MTNRLLASASAAALIAAALITISASAQGQNLPRDLFTTDDIRNDPDLWTDPAYFRNNATRQIRGQAFNFDSGGEGTGQLAGSRAYGTEGNATTGSVDELLRSPYPYTSAIEHYQAWLEEADGGTQHTKETTPDWSGRWLGGVGLNAGNRSPADIVQLIQPEYRVAYVLNLQAETQARLWDANTFCLPPGFFDALGPNEWITTPGRTWTHGEGNTENTIRWIYTDGSGHIPEQFQYPKWLGASIGFWDSDALIIHTNQVKGWHGGLYEYSDQLEVVERYRKVGDVIEAEITVYDPEVYTRPLHATGSFELDPETRVELNRMLYNSCTDTNGPSMKVHLDERGLNNERLPGEALYWDAADPRPWLTYLEEGERRYNAYLAAGGTPAHALNNDPTGQNITDRTGE
ncbi:MAG: hypothetical protein ACKVG0_08660 [Alphaproteobacteria bacterium]